jgi:hypothetical protein
MPRHPSPPRGLSIAAASLTDNGQDLLLDMTIKNDTARTLHFYSSIRAMRYDKATRTLEVQLSDDQLVEPRSLRGPAVQQTTFILPSFTSVDPHGEAKLSLTIPRTLTRVNAEESSDAALKFEVVPCHEATTVAIDLAWSDVPFYADPRVAGEYRRQLAAWAKGHASYSIARQPDSGDTGGSRVNP